MSFRTSRTRSLTLSSFVVTVLAKHPPDARDEFCGSQAVIEDPLQRFLRFVKIGGPCVLAIATRHCRVRRSIRISNAYSINLLDLDQLLSQFLIERYDAPALAFACFVGE